MSFYNFKLNDPSSFTTSNSPDSKSPGRFVHKTFQDFQAKPSAFSNPSSTSVSNTPVENDGRGKFALSGWKDKIPVAPGGETSRFRLIKPHSTPHDPLVPPPVPSLLETPWPQPTEQQDDEEIAAVSITSSLQSITHTYSPLSIAQLNSLGSPTSIRLVKLGGQSAWHTHENTDEIFILLRGQINLLYRSREGGEEKCAKVIGGELLRVPMRVEHCVVAEEGTEVLLLEGNDVLPTRKGQVLIVGE